MKSKERCRGAARESPRGSTALAPKLAHVSSFVSQNGQATVAGRNRNPQMMIDVEIPTNTDFAWIQSGARFRPSTVSRTCPCLVQRVVGLNAKLPVGSNPRHAAWGRRPFDTCLHEGIHPSEPLCSAPKRTLILNQDISFPQIGTRKSSPQTTNPNQDRGLQICGERENNKRT